MMVKIENTERFPNMRVTEAMSLKFLELSVKPYTTMRSQII